MKIDNFDINSSTFILAEIGTNHNGDFNLAKTMIKEAAIAGVDGVKFQIFKAEKLSTKSFPVFPRIKLLGYRTQFERFKDLEFNDQQIVELYEFAKEVNLVFLTTPFDTEAVDSIEPLCPAFKIASADLVNVPLLRHIASKRKPVILSTGQATIEEIDQAVKIFPSDSLSLLHCVSSYPTPDEEANLSSITFLKSRYNVPIGYSDHTKGILACIAAVAMGAKIIEKHFTYDKNQGFGDHPLSADTDEMKSLVNEVRRLENMLGNEEKKCQDCEKISKEQLRRRLYMSKEIKIGYTLQEDMVIPLMSSEGILANRIDDFIGKKAVKDMNAGEVIMEEGFS